MSPQDELDALLREIRACAVCAAHLPLGPRPVVRGGTSARILLISQAPGTRVHETGLSFNDRSGDVLRGWMGIDRDTFYDEDKIAIVGTGFCYPGRDKAGGDKPPRPECAPLWQPRLVPLFPKVELTILAGSYAIDYRLGKRRKATLGATIAAWRDYLPELMILPHPSWRNVLWMRKNPWFEIEVLPELRRRVAALTS
jgi:uracil-DNA glycosylase